MSPSRPRRLGVRAPGVAPDPVAPLSGWLDVDPTVAIDAPVAEIHGWALAEPDLDSVEVRVGDQPPRRARTFATWRPDVGLVRAEPSAPIAGWSAIVDVPEEPGSTVSVSATAVGANRFQLLGSQEVVVGADRCSVTRDLELLATLRDRADRDAVGAPARDGPEGEMRLLVVTHSLDLGGAQLILQRLLRHLASEPGPTCMVLSRGGGRFADELERLGMEVHITGQLPGDGLEYESRMRELSLLAGRFDANVALVNTSLMFWGVDLAQRLGLPVVWSIHESLPVAVQLGPLDHHVRSRFTEALERADRIAFPADSTRDLYRGYGDDDRLVRIDCGVPLEELDAERRLLDRERLRAQHGFRDHEHLLICVATVEPRKAQSSLALAVSRLWPFFPNLRLAIIGDVPSGYSRGLHELIARLPFGSEWITTVPLTEEVAPWYAMADGFALASDLESMPLSVMEAMVYELPVLSTEVFGVGELITDGVDGLLCEVGSLAALGGGLRRLLTLGAADREQMGSAAKGSLRESKDFVDSQRAYVSLLSELRAISSGPMQAGTAVA